MTGGAPPSARSGQLVLRTSPCLHLLCSPSPITHHFPRPSALLPGHISAVWTAFHWGGDSGPVAGIAGPVVNLPRMVSRAIVWPGTGSRLRASGVYRSLGGRLKFTKAREPGMLTQLGALASGLVGSRKLVSVNRAFLCFPYICGSYASCSFSMC